MPALEMKEVFGRLQAAGYGKQFVKSVALPSWWEPAVASTSEGMTQTLLTISRRLGVSYEQLSTPGQPVAGALPDVRFKRDRPVAREEFTITASVAARAARTVLQVLPSAGALDEFRDPIPLRESILQSGAPWIGLRELVEFCWTLGVPVLHLSGLPASTNRKRIHLPAGMAIRVGDRHAVVVCRRDQYESKHLFNVAHEVAHVMLGHVTDDVLVDDDVDRDSEDPQESEANEYALRLLCGAATSFMASGRYLKAEALARAAREKGLKECIAPGHIALNYAHTMTKQTTSVHYGAAMKALKLLGEGGGVEVLADALESAVPWPEMRADDEEFVRRITGLADE